jgi:hypothetical protein
MRIRRLRFSDGLQVGETGLEFLADHLAHADEYAYDLRNVGSGRTAATRTTTAIAMILSIVMRSPFRR